MIKRAYTTLGNYCTWWLLKGMTSDQNKLTHLVSPTAQ